LYYRLNQFKRDSKIKDSIIGTFVAASSKNTGVMSDLTEENYSCNPNDHDVIPETQEDVVQTLEKMTNVRGHSKGSTKAASLVTEQRQDELGTKCAILFHAERQKAKQKGCKFPIGTLNAIVREEEVKAGIPLMSTLIETV
jgi:hypothetical protein